MTDAVNLCCMLWARDGESAGLTAYEDRVLELIPDHGGRVVQRVRNESGADGPDEVQTYRFPSHASLDSYLADPRRLALAAERDRVIERTELFPVRVLS